MKKIDGLSSLVVKRNEISSIPDVDIKGKELFQKLVDSMKLDEEILGYIDEVFERFPSVDNITNIMFNLMPRLIDAKKFEENFKNLSFGFKEMTDTDGYTITTVNGRIVVMSGLVSKNDKLHFDVRMSFDSFIAVGRGIILEITEMANKDGGFVQNDDDVDMKISTNELEILGGIKVSKSDDLIASQKLDTSHNYKTNVVSLDSIVGGQSVKESEAAAMLRNAKKKDISDDVEQDKSGGSIAGLDEELLKELGYDYEYDADGNLIVIFEDGHKALGRDLDTLLGATRTSDGEVAPKPGVSDTDTTVISDIASEKEDSETGGGAVQSAGASLGASVAADTAVSADRPTDVAASFKAKVDTPVAEKTPNSGSKRGREQIEGSAEAVEKIAETVNYLNKNLFGKNTETILSDPSLTTSLASTPIVANTLTSSVNEQSDFSGCGSNLYSDVGSFDAAGTSMFSICAVDGLSINDFLIFYRPSVRAVPNSDSSASQPTPQPTPTVDAYTCYGNSIDPVSTTNNNGDSQNIQQALDGQSYDQKFQNWYCGVDSSYGGTTTGANAYCGVNDSYSESGQIYDWSCIENKSTTTHSDGSDMYCGVNNSMSYYTYSTGTSCITNYSANGFGLSVGTYCNPNVSACGMAMSVGTFCAGNASACGVAASVATVSVASASVCGAAMSIGTICAANASACGANVSVMTLCAANASACGSDAQIVAACVANASACGANASIGTACAANASACMANVGIVSACAANASACGSKISIANSCAVDAKACGAKTNVGVCGVDVGVDPVGVRVWCGINTGLDPLACCIVNIIPLLPSC